MCFTQNYIPQRMKQYLNRAETHQQLSLEPLPTAWWKQHRCSAKYCSIPSPMAFPPVHFHFCRLLNLHISRSFKILAYFL